MMYYAAIFLPLLSAAIAGFFGRALGNKIVNLLTSFLLVASAVFSVMIFDDVVMMGQIQTLPLLTWVSSGTLSFDWALKFDSLSAVMLVVVNVVSACVHIYSVGYMHHDKSVPRFMSYLGLFTFMMLMLVTGDNLVQMFFGWEGVGLASYLLIGFWVEKDSANAASIKAFVVNRVGDFGFTLGIFALFLLFGTVNLDAIFAKAAVHNYPVTMEFLGYQIDSLTVACALLFIGAMGKSAQLGLHTWLPDAMEGPTPVSALIHAATMVTAGVFMVVRMSPIFEYAPDVLAVITVVGATTAIFAASIALVQNDIKRVIAYSTCSQLGYMFFAIGVSAYGAAIFHLFTHAFFKALLFLGAGSVIHAMDDEQDMRKMGGLWKKLPFTYVMMWVGSLALAGVPFFAGYYSKDMILESAFAAHTGVGEYAYWIGITAAFMTAFYSWRLLFMTFHGTPRASQKVMKHVHESPPIILLPLLVLAIGAVIAGMVGYDYFVGHDRLHFWGASIFTLQDVIDAAHHVPLWVKKLPLLVTGGGIVLAWLLYVRFAVFPAWLAARFKAVYALLLNKWYFDELYNKVFIDGANALGQLFWKRGDEQTIDRLGPDGLAKVTKGFAAKLSQLQTGYVYHYAFAMLIGLVAFLTYLTVEAMQHV